MTKPNFHTNAAALIVNAAEKSGLLESVARLLRFNHQDLSPTGDCMACALLDQLTEDFDYHICVPHLVLEVFRGEGSYILEGSAQEVAPYLGVS